MWWLSSSLKDAQWYPPELRHLTVVNGHWGQGHAKAPLREAERRAQAQRILHCTIGANNDESRGLSEGAGFRSASEFFYLRSGNNL
jgi:hypothetical protein